MRRYVGTQSGHSDVPGHWGVPRARDSSLGHSSDDLKVYVLVNAHGMRE